MSRVATKEKDRRTVALAGNPNVGKSTLFNALTGLHQHTGNWTGKTVGCARGQFVFGEKTYDLIDLPGTYSMTPHAAEEAAARDFLLSGQAHAVCVVCDALTLERQLILVLQLMQLTDRPMTVVLNFTREAERRGRCIDIERLSLSLGVAVVASELCDRRAARRLRERLAVCAEGDRDEDRTPLLSCGDTHTPEQLAALAARITAECVTAVEKRGGGEQRDGRLDEVLTGKVSAFPMMILLVALLFWITLVGANGISDRLMSLFGWAEKELLSVALALRLPDGLIEPLLYGVFRTVGWVVAVMLPPMAVFFPLFTVLEDLGYLPRIAFNLDRAFHRAHSCGKQALTMCMSIGCNAVGVTGCRIVDSPRERRVAMLTSSLMPCNGRLPTLLSLVATYLTIGGSYLSTAVLCLCIVGCVGMTLIVSRVLSATVLRGERSSFLLELPPYRIPRVGEVIVRSVLDRTLFVLGRAVAVAAPAGLLLWGMANLSVGGEVLTVWGARLLHPIGWVLGMDGAILLAFLLALPASEIFLPLLMLIYAKGSELLPVASMGALRDMLTANGWTALTAVCTVIFLLFHWPCATTVLTLRREGGGRMAWLGVLIPTLIGAALCALIALVVRAFS